jgi:methylphosphotriester-DNA--protein-cysteine methyltransferase
VDDTEALVDPELASRIARYKLNIKVVKTTEIRNAKYRPTLRCVPTLKRERRLCVIENIVNQPLLVVSRKPYDS